MTPIPRPVNEADRLSALRSYDVLDSACEESFDSIARLAARLTGAPIAMISLTDADRQWFKARVGLEVEAVHRDLGFCGHAILRPGEAMMVPDAALDERFADNPLVRADHGIRFYAGMPLVNPEGYALGTLCIIDHQPRELDRDGLETLTSLAQTVMTTLELRRTMLRVRRMALTDSLTGLANRAALRDALTACIAGQRMRDGDAFSLIYLDLDGFKAVNDAFGHTAGDAVLTEVAVAIQGAVGPADLAARIGGDEFAVLAPGPEGAALAEAVRAAIADRMGRQGWGVTASVGVAHFASTPRDADAAIAAADRLMYAAKTAGKDRVASG